MPKRIRIQETVGFDVADIKLDESVQLAEASDKGKLPSKITTVVEAIHSGLTKNYTFYPADNLRDSVDTWVVPYHKPVIKNHNVYEEPVGRVKRADFKSSQLAPDKHTIQLELEITDADTIQKVMDGRYQTLSIGGSTTSAICSICGKDLVKEGYCGHMKGRTYEGKRAHWIIGPMEFEEISWVNVPADANAQVIQKNASSTKESISEGKGGQVDMPDVTQHSEEILDQIDSIRVSASQDGDNKLEEEMEKKEDTTQTQENQTSETNTQTQENQDGDENTKSLEEQVADLQKQLEAMTKAKEDAEKRALAAETERDALQGQKEALETELATLKTDLQTSESENKTLMNQNVNLATYVHKSLAENVASLELVLGKIEESDMESKVAELAKESSKSLKEKMNELMKEKPQRIIQTIDNPGGKVGDSVDTTDGDTDEIKESTKQEKKDTLSIEEFAETFSKVFSRN